MSLRRCDDLNLWLFELQRSGGGIDVHKGSGFGLPCAGVDGEGLLIEEVSTLVGEVGGDVGGVGVLLRLLVIDYVLVVLVLLPILSLSHTSQNSSLESIMCGLRLELQVVACGMTLCVLLLLLMLDRLFRIGWVLCYLVLGLSSRGVVVVAIRLVIRLVGVILRGGLIHVIVVVREIHINLSPSSCIIVREIFFIVVKGIPLLLELLVLVLLVCVLIIHVGYKKYE